MSLISYGALSGSGFGAAQPVKYWNGSTYVWETITYGFSAAVHGYGGYRGAFAVDGVGNLWELYYTGSSWAWSLWFPPSGISACSGGFTGTPAAVADGNYVGVFLRCGHHIIEKYSTNGSWQGYIDHGDIVDSRTCTRDLDCANDYPCLNGSCYAITTNVNSDPAVVTNSSYTGVFVIDNTMYPRAWELTGPRGSSSGWTWYGHGISKEWVGMAGNPSMVHNPNSGYYGGLFLENNGDTAELYFDGSSHWYWTEHKDPSQYITSPCNYSGIGPAISSWTMGTDTSSGDVFGVAYCSNNNPYKTHVMRLYYHSGWTWVVTTDQNSTFGHFLGEPFGVKVASADFQAYTSTTLTDNSKDAFDWWQGTTTNGTWTWNYWYNVDHP